MRGLDCKYLFLNKFLLGRNCAAFIGMWRGVVLFFISLIVFEGAAHGGAPFSSFLLEKAANATCKMMAIGLVSGSVSEADFNDIVAAAVNATGYEASDLKADYRVVVFDGYLSPEEAFDFMWQDFLQSNLASGDARWVDVLEIGVGFCAFADGLSGQEGPVDKATNGYLLIVLSANPQIKGMVYLQCGHLWEDVDGDGQCDERVPAAHVAFNVGGKQYLTGEDGGYCVPIPLVGGGALGITFDDQQLVTELPVEGAHRVDWIERDFCLH